MQTNVNGETANGQPRQVVLTDDGDGLFVLSDPTGVRLSGDALDEFLDHVDSFKDQLEKQRAEQPDEDEHIDPSDLMTQDELEANGYPRDFNQDTWTPEQREQYKRPTEYQAGDRIQTPDPVSHTSDADADAEIRAQNDGHQNEGSTAPVQPSEADANATSQNTGPLTGSTLDSENLGGSNGEAENTQVEVETAKVADPSVPRSDTSDELADATLQNEEKPSSPLSE